jgi:hypothetical protein
MKTITFNIHHPGEKAAGIHPFTDKVTMTCKSGQWGGAPVEFEKHMLVSLWEWYDGADVSVAPGPDERVPTETQEISRIEGCNITETSVHPSPVPTNTPTLDMCAAGKWDLVGAIMAKVEFNMTRPRMHGGKKF